MNDKKICFICCVNNETFWEECLFYLERLVIPEGYEVEIMPLREEKSMASAYNKAVSASDARYWVYLHQDVFIVYRYFLQDVLDIFRKDADICMIGMVGCEQMPADGVMWNGRRCGNVYGSDLPVADVPIKEYRYHPEQDGYTFVQAVDGLLMVTDGDVPWREDLFDGWDFYDVSQCFEYLRRGKKIVVPTQRRPWCIHNDGVLSMWNYDKYRNILLREYSDILGG